MKRKLFAGVAVAGAVVFGAATPLSASIVNLPVSELGIRDGSPQAPSRNDLIWYRGGTTVGGGVTLTKDFGAPPPPQNLGDGAVAFTTNGLSTAQAQLFTNWRVDGTPLADVDGTSYWTYQSSAQSGSATAEPLYEIVVDIDGDLTTTDDRTTLVYDPQYNQTDGTDPQGSITPDAWQYWDATAGSWSSSRDITCGDFSVTGSADGPPDTNPSDVAAACPNATVVSLGIAVGPNNPNVIVAADGVHFETPDNAYFWDFGPK
jgi:hypothetical protein